MTEGGSILRQDLFSPRGGADERLRRIEAAGDNPLDPLDMRAHRQVKRAFPFVQDAAIPTWEGA